MQHVSTRLPFHLYNKMQKCCIVARSQLQRGAQSNTQPTTYVVSMSPPRYEGPYGTEVQVQVRRYEGCVPIKPLQGQSHRGVRLLHWDHLFRSCRKNGYVRSLGPRCWFCAFSTPSNPSVQKKKEPDLSTKSSSSWPFPVVNSK